MAHWDLFWSAYWPALGLILALMTALWLVSLPLRDASIVDPFWGAGFVVLAWFYAWQTPAPLAGRPLLVLILASVWGLRLALHLLRRNWGQGEDFRYRQFRRRYGPERYWWVSYFQTFLLQGGLMWLVSAPLLGAQLAGPEPLGWLDLAAIAVWLVGLLFEAGGDWQLARFKADPANRGKLLTSGFWRYTRHPNYFGDAAVWWAFGLLAVVGGAAPAALGAVVMTYLLRRVSGVTLLEKTLRRDKPGYEVYAARTRAFLPWFPRAAETVNAHACDHA